MVRHPWYAIAFWVVLFLVTLPFLGQLSTVTSNSANTLPSNSPSATAQAEFDRLFPNQTSGSNSLLLLLGANVTGPVAERSVLAIVQAIQEDRNLTDVSSVSTIYSAFASYLAGEAQLASRFLGSAQNSTPPLAGTVQTVAELLWTPPALFVADWNASVAAHPGVPPAEFNYPAFRNASAALSGNSSALALLGAFYRGYGGTASGFNGSAACAADPANVTACASEAARVNEAPLVPALLPATLPGLVGRTALETLGVGNATNATSLGLTSARVLNATTGLPTSWLLAVEAEFPHGTPSASEAFAWAAGRLALSGIVDAPLALPFAISREYLDPSRTATVLVVEFTVASGYTTPSGTNPVYSDVRAINSLVPAVLATTDPSHSLVFYQTGGAALDENEQADLSQSLALVLPLTVIVLILITMLYFRAPLAPMLTFSGIGIALVLGLGGVLIIGRATGAVDPTALTLVETFVLGIGTDYSIFLVARYREELTAGRSAEEALVNSVSWAGQSVATSGSTALIATLALAFSGIALLSQWGEALSIAILVTVVLSLTFVPALLRLVGPRVFWPATGARFERHAAQRRERIDREATYFYRVGRLTQRHPARVVALIVLVSVPLVYVALQVPLSYDFYAQLPAGHPATDGLRAYGTHFGEGAAFPSFALVTFAAPLATPAGVNASELSDVGALTERASAVAGVAEVQSPVGPFGAAVATWENFSSLPPATQANLLGVLSGYVGSDGRTVAFSLTTSASGLSLAAVRAVESVRASFEEFAAGHPEVAAVRFGGSAMVTNDLAQQTLLATERLILAVSIGLVVVLLAVLRSWIIPLMAVATIALSIAWAWALTYLVFTGLFALPLFFYVPTVLFILILGLGIDYNIFLLTRVREERLRGRTASDAAVEGVARTGGIITAAAVILASAFGILLLGNFTLLRAIGFAVATAVVLDAMVVRTFLVPSALHLLGERVWSLSARRGGPTATTAGRDGTGTDRAATGVGPAASGFGND